MDYGPTTPELKKAVGLWVEGKVDAALKQARKAEKAALNANDLHGRAQAYLLLAGIYKSGQRHNRAMRYYQRALYISDDIGDTRGMVEAHRGMGLCLWRTGVGNPLEHFRLCRRHIDVLDLNERIALFLDMGTINAEQRNFGEAEFFFNKSVELLEKHKKDLKKQGGAYLENLARAYNVLGMMYLDIEKPRESVKHFDKLIELGKKEKMRWAEEYGLINWAHALAEAGFTNKAKDYNERGLELARDLGDVNMEGGYWRKEALISRQKKDYKSALESIDRAISTYEFDLDIPAYAGLMLIEKGRILKQRRDKKGADKAFEAASEKFEEAGNWSEAVRAKGMMSG
jgi:tetratricopeptide (TPR) repeat protein